jgi:hypothetical protein
LIILDALIKQDARSLLSNADAYALIVVVLHGG